MSGSANGQANRQIDTCITKAVYDSLAIGNEIAHEFGHSGFIENILDQRAVQAKLIENLENQVVVSEDISQALSANVGTLKKQNKSLSIQLRKLKVQIPIFCVFAACTGYVIGVAGKR
jgi:hypothetical protein